MVKIAHAARDLARIGEISRVLVRHGFGEFVSRVGLRRPRSSAPPPPATTDGSELAAAAFPEEMVRGDRERREISAAVRIRMVLEDLGPTFVKLGQIASTRSDVLPADVVAELSKLQDAVPPVAFSLIREEIERSLGAPLSDLFASIEEHSLAAGSIAQVHRARLRLPASALSDAVMPTDPASDAAEPDSSHDATGANDANHANHANHAPPQHDAAADSASGTPSAPLARAVDVVVKVQRPGIAGVIATDLDILHNLAAVIERAIPESRPYSPTGLVRQFDRAITGELDFAGEADNAVRFAQNFEGHADVKFPRVYREASSKHVLTLEYLDGLKLRDAAANGYSRKTLSRVALHAIMKQVFEDGFFHADPHPGNVVILGEPERPIVAFVDLGMVGRLSPRMRDLAIDFMFAALRKDYAGMADALAAVGTPTRRIDRDAFEAEVALRAERYLDKPLKDIVLSSVVRDLIQGATQFGLEIPTDFTMVGKALMTLEGTGRELDPELDVLGESRPLFAKLVRKRYSPERIGTNFLRRLERLSDTTYNLPRQLEEALDDLRRGHLSVRIANKDLVSATDRVGRRIFWGLWSSALLLAGTASWMGGHDTLGAALLALCALGIAVHAIWEVSVSLAGSRRAK